MTEPPEGDHVYEAPPALPPIAELDIDTVVRVGEDRWRLAAVWVREPGPDAQGGPEITFFNGEYRQRLVTLVALTHDAMTRVVRETVAETELVKPDYEEDDEG